MVNPMAGEQYTSISGVVDNLFGGTIDPILLSELRALAAAVRDDWPVTCSSRGR
jgi:hypothetical protein